MNGRVKLTDECKKCGFKVTLDGDDGLALLREVDRLHDTLRPNCEVRRVQPAAATS